MKLPDKNITIMVVENFIPMKGIIKNILRQLGYRNIIETGDGKIALDILKKEKIDLVISEWDTPQMSGLELLKAMKKDNELESIPFLIINGMANKENIINAAQAGVSGYIIKPFTAEIVKEKIDKIFSGSKK